MWLVLLSVAWTESATNCWNVLWHPVTDIWNRFNLISIGPVSVLRSYRPLNCVCLCVGGCTCVCVLQIHLLHLTHLNTPARRRTPMYTCKSVCSISVHLFPWTCLFSSYTGNFIFSVCLTPFTVLDRSLWDTECKYSEMRWENERSKSFLWIVNLLQLIACQW